MWILEACDIFLYPEKCLAKMSHLVFDPLIDSIHSNNQLKSTRWAQRKTDAEGPVMGKVSISYVPTIIHNKQPQYLNDLKHKHLFYSLRSYRLAVGYPISLGLTGPKWALLDSRFVVELKSFPHVFILFSVCILGGVACFSHCSTSVIKHHGHGNCLS